ncbi:MAG: DNA polymerase III subunit chi [Candidatus Liberibacter europaeus]|uniref:DNA polymerase III subunit chi n=1 Tax=Candidatus Liberibacter europaeus TaxID=744859 RepID=A0A2T4VXR0_9HYPH|nr:DNA polymerase III subunit chi [Candidatus Liberibacter europaeus]PTL86565.1 MAG: DNA polymerase III subunit chi [Candidatus Liberibacter europaeus]
MTEFIFYRISDDWRIHLPLLLERIYRDDKIVSIQCGSESMRDSLNEYLWTWKEDSFLPHGTDVGEEGMLASFQPILLTVNSDNANASTVRFFIDKALMDMDDIGNYQKLVFIVDKNDQESREWASTNWRHLKDGGYKLIFHHNDSGRWKTLTF